MASKLFKKNFKNSFFSKSNHNNNNDDKEKDNDDNFFSTKYKSKIKPSTPTPLKQSGKSSSTTSLYASLPALSIPLIENITSPSAPPTNTTGRLKLVRDFFRNKFHLNNKTANKHQNDMTQSVISTKTTTASDTLSILNTTIDDIPKSKSELTKQNKSNLKERLMKSKFNDKSNYVDVQTISDDEGISKTPDSLKNYLNIQKNINLNKNINKNNSFGYSSESFASLGSIDSGNTNNQENLESISTTIVPKNTISSNASGNLTDNSMHKAKIQAASYRNMRKTLNSKKRQIINELNDLSNTSNDNNNNNNNNSILNSFTMDPIEENISFKKDDNLNNNNCINEDYNEENNNNNINNKELFKKLLQQQLKTHLNEQPKFILNKSNTQLDKTEFTSATQLPLPALPQASNELLEKLKNNLRSTTKRINNNNNNNNTNQQQHQSQTSDIVTIKLFKPNNDINKRNSMDVNLVFSSKEEKDIKRSSLIVNTNHNNNNNDEPIYDNLTSLLKKQKSINDKIKSDDESNDNEISNRVSRRKKFNELNNLSRKTTIITSVNDIDNNNNTQISNNTTNSGSKLGHSKSMKIIETDIKNSLLSQSGSDLCKKYSIKQKKNNTNNNINNINNEPSWREMALKKQSAWNNSQNGSVENLINRNMTNSSCLEKVDDSMENLDASYIGKVKSLIKDLEK